MVAAPIVKTFKLPKWPVPEAALGGVPGAEGEVEAEILAVVVVLVSVVVVRVSPLVSLTTLPTPLHPSV